MALDLADRHAAGVHRDDLLVEPRKPPLIAGDQLRIKRAFAVAGNPEIELRGLGQHRLLRIAVAAVTLARRRLAVEMIIDLGVENALRQGLLQLVEQAVLGKNRLRVTPRQQIVQGILLDRHMRPP